MNDKKKKLFTIAGCSIAVLALIVAIAMQFHKTPPAEDNLSTSGTTSSEVTPKSDVSVLDKTGEKMLTSSRTALTPPNRWTVRRRRQISRYRIYSRM